MRPTSEGRCVAIIGCGYVGSALGMELAHGGHDVLGTTTTPQRTGKLRRLGIEPEVLDVADVERLHTLLTDREVVYLTVAAKARGQGYRETYLEGVRSLVRAARNTAVRRVIYTSSTRVYGQDDGSWVDESSPTEPRDEKGKLLLEAERTLLEGAQGIGDEGAVAATVVRMSGIYGPGRDPADRIRTLAGTQRRDGEAYVNLIHVDDIIMALMALLRVPHHGVLNLSDDRPTTRREYYDGVLAEAGLPPIRWVSGAKPPDLGKRVRNDLIKRTLNLTLIYPAH